MLLPYLLSAALLLTLLAWLGHEVLGWRQRAVRWAMTLAWSPFVVEWGRQSFVDGPPTVFLTVMLGVVLGLLAWWGSIFPNRPLVLLLAVPTVLSISVVFLPGVWVGLAVLNALIAGVAIIDMFSLARQKSFEAERQVGLTASLGKPHPVSLTITNRAGREQPVHIRDGVPPELTAEPDEFLINLTPASRSTLRYDLRASSRGEFLLKEVHLSVSSRWGIWQRLLRLPCESRLNVYPDMKQLGEYAVLARTNRLSLMGLRRTRRIGQDNEFERLRDYTVDDNYKHIEWRSTARRGKLTVKDFQANQSQRVVFMVDCGRMMTGESVTGEAAGPSMLDHALNSALLLSFVALRQNDQVGLMCFSDEVHSMLPPKGGREQMNRILHACYNQFPRMVESRYDEAFHRLSETVRKRALVILITNVIDEVNAHQISRHLTTLSGKHLPMGVVLRDHALFDPLGAVEDEYEAHAASGDNTPGGVLSIPEHRLFPAAAAADILLWRRRVLANLENRGVLLVDTFPEDLTAPLVNQYMEIKARHLL